MDGQSYRQSQQQLSPTGAGSLAAKSRIFYKNKKLSSGNTSSNNKNNSKASGQRSQQPSKQVLPTDIGSNSRTNNFKRYFVGGNRSNNGPQNDEIQDMRVNETSNGIEVSLPGSQGSRRAVPDLTREKPHGRTPVISLKDQIRQRQRVYKNQFSEGSTTSSFGVSTVTLVQNNWRPKGHRIPLMGITPVESLYNDSLTLLQNMPSVDEWTAVKQEIVYLEKEISSLEGDRIWLEQSQKNKNKTSSNSYSKSGRHQTDADPSKPYSNAHENNDKTITGTAAHTWDLSNLLKVDTMKPSLSSSERATLQQQRGNSISIHLSNNRTRELFIQKCGGDIRPDQRTILFEDDPTITTLLPGNCNPPHGAATNLLNINLIFATTKSADGSSLYFSRDGDNTSQCIGRVPNTLYRRLQEDEGVTGRHGIGDIVYLSTGQRGCYFVKFNSGESWWGSSVKDSDFHSIMHSFDVYRVAFGSIQRVELNIKEQPKPLILSTDNTENQKVVFTNSWIIISYDGRVAWKNIPSRLSRKLEECLIAPIEVSLGPGDSYFVRFMDGSTDFCLPAKAARVCERIEQLGGDITSISLNPDISHDFVIRHTEIKL